MCPGLANLPGHAAAALGLQGCLANAWPLPERRGAAGSRPQSHGHADDSTRDDVTANSDSYRIAGNRASCHDRPDRLIDPCEASPYVKAVSPAIRHTVRSAARWWRSRVCSSNIVDHLSTDHIGQSPFESRIASVGDAVWLRASLCPSATASHRSSWTRAADVSSKSSSQATLAPRNTRTVRRAASTR